MDGENNKDLQEIELTLDKIPKNQSFVIKIKIMFITKCTRKLHGKQK
jgi:hypothetical protein